MRTYINKNYARYARDIVLLGTSLHYLVALPADYLLGSSGASTSCCGS